jgi:ATP-dependent DNA ligase
MLAERGLPKGSLERWAVEPKLDGWRATVLVDDERLVVRTRRGHAITETIAGLDALATAGRCLLLDGELVAGAGHNTGRAGPPRRPLPFAAFDV